MSGTAHGPTPPRYELRVRGHLGQTILTGFPEFRAEIRGPDTLLRGALADQAAMHGVLARVEALGLELLELRRLPLTDDDGSPVGGEGSSPHPS